MRDVLRLVLGIVAGLGLFSGAAALVVVSRTARRWFGSGLLPRSELAVRGAGGTAALYRGHPARLETLPALYRVTGASEGAT